MAGKRIAAPEETAEVKRKGSRRAIWIAGAVLAVLVAAWVGLCLYAGGYGGVFPGVTMAGEDLGGLSLDHAEEQLSGALEGFLTGRVVAVAADGEDLGTYDLAELGAYAVAGEAAQAAWDVGRESGVLGWLKNGWTMLRGLLGGETALEPRVYYDEDRLSAAVEEMAGAFDQEPVDASYELTRDGLFATRERDGRALDREGLAQALSLRFYGNLNRAEPERRGNTLVYRVADCRVQSARTRKGMPLHPCKSVGLIEYGGFARTIDDRITCRCLSCYPEVTDETCSCAWEFTLQEDGGGSM